MGPIGLKPQMLKLHFIDDNSNVMKLLLFIISDGENKMVSF